MHLYFQYIYWNLTQIQDLTHPQTTDFHPHLFILNFKIATFPLQRAVGEGLCISLTSCYQMTPSQHLRMGSCLILLSCQAWPGHVCGYTFPRSLYFLTDHQWCWPREPAGGLEYLSSPLYGSFPLCWKNKVEIYHVLALDLAFKLIILQSHPGHPTFLSSATQGEKFFLLLNY